MSMAVDLSTPLTQEEREYLAARGRYADLERADAMHGVTDAPALPDGDGTGPTQYGTASYDVRDQRIAALERELALLKGETDDSEEEADDSEDGEVSPYEQWTVQELDAELKRRKLPVTGNKDAKVTALYDHDDAAGS